MASSSLQTFMRERKYPFIFSLFVLLLCVSLLLITIDRYTYSPFSFYSSSSSLSPSSSTTNLNQNHHSTTTTSSSSSSSSSSPPPVSKKPKSLDVTKIPSSSSSSSNWSWEVCKGAMANDYIPCLDNMKAIKALPSRRHMEHRERHCPTPSPRCLIPLPEGYKTPVLWPKSRDMVRL